MGPALLLALTVGLLSGCRGDEASARVQLRIFAASSLTEAFQDLEAGFEAAHPDVDVVLTFAGSQVLRMQLEQGAGADLFASANEEHMAALVEAGVVSHARPFARNQLVIIVPPDNPAGIGSFRDLPRATRLVIGADNVPVGIYTLQLLENAGAALGVEFAARIREHVVSEEGNVRLVRAKIELGEADAAIVYQTDATSSDRVRQVPIPEELNVQARYPIGPLASSGRREIADRFVEFLFSPEGRQLLRRHGFLVEVR